ncbi:MAG TPA: DUF4097 family beta strand repeat-containing protein [Bryobacteraceae bacterium]|jgi:hypothetical protein|nr:DUF4097 family beta strand repeat-containing protein [Bryobacteraceae bacterium]
MRSVGFTILFLSLAFGLTAADEEQGSFDKALPVSGKVDLDVKTDSGGISIVPGSGGMVRVHAILKMQHDWFGSGDAMGRIRELERNPPVEQNGNHIRIGYVRDPGLLRGISMRLEIETPPDTQVQAHADSGGIRVEGLRSSVNCKTDSGGIQISDIKADVRAAADSGGIRIEDVTGPVFARVDSGGIVARGIAGAVDAQADSGGVRIAQTTPGPILARTDSGGVTVMLAPAAGYDLKVDSDSGNISVPEMSANAGFSRHHRDGKVRGGGPLVQVQVGSGSVTIN